MEISWFQAAILGLFACLSSMPGLGGTSIGNYTLGRPLIGGLVCGLVLGDLKTGILVGIAMQLVYIAFVTSFHSVFVIILFHKLVYSCDNLIDSNISISLFILFITLTNSWQFAFSPFNRTTS